MAARHRPVVAIADTVMSPLRRLSRHALLVSETAFGAFRSLTATQAITISLAVAVASARRHDS